MQLAFGSLFSESARLLLDSISLFITARTADDK
jgi:hypothetical protein